MTVTSGGQVIVGGSVSLTVTVKLQPTAPQALEAVTDTIVVPTGKVVPGFCEYVMVGAGLPVALAPNVTTRPQFPAELFVVILAGHDVIAGAVLIVSAATAEVLLPQVLANTARYWLLLCEALAVKLSGLLVDPGLLV